MRVCAISLGLALVFLATGCAEELTLPEDLLGTYTTSARQYTGRSLELTQVEIVFGLGEAGVSRHTIESVSREEEDGKMLYTLAFDGEGGADHLLFYHDEGSGSIVLRNQPSITWTR